MTKRTATERPRRRTRTKGAAVVAFLMAALSIAFLQFSVSVAPARAVNGTCPGGSSSGQSSSNTCPNLFNGDLLSQRHLPNVLYRGDSRLPYYVFTNGFRSRGANDNLVSHVQGDRAGNSNYISTTGTLSVSEPFARSQGLRNLETEARRPRCSAGREFLYSLIPGFGNYLMASCVDGQVTANSYVYMIDPVWARNALYVPDQIRGNADLYNHYASQDEWAYVHQIPREAIIGVRIYRMTAHAIEDRIRTETITFHYDHFVANPHHVEARLVYNPGNDSNSHFTYYSDLNIPELPANQYTRGCTAINRCRGGGS